MNTFLLDFYGFFVLHFTFFIVVLEESVGIISKNCYVIANISYLYILGILYTLYTMYIVHVKYFEIFETLKNTTYTALQIKCLLFVVWTKHLYSGIT